MAKINLDKLDLDELKSLQKDVGKRSRNTRPENARKHWKPLRPSRERKAIRSPS